GIAEALHHVVVERGAHAARAGIPQPHLAALGNEAHLHDLVFHAEIGQDAHRVRTDLDAGADFAQRGRFLQHVDLHASPEQGQGASQATDSRTSNHYTQGLRHVFLLLFMGRIRSWIWLRISFRSAREFFREFMYRNTITHI